MHFDRYMIYFLSLSIYSIVCMKHIQLKRNFNENGRKSFDFRKSNKEKKLFPTHSTLASLLICYSQEKPPQQSKIESNFFPSVSFTKK